MLVGLLALLMGEIGLEVAFDPVVGGAQAFSCFVGKALQCWWLWNCRAEMVPEGAAGIHGLGHPLGFVPVA